VEYNRDFPKLSPILSSLRSSEINVFYFFSIVFSGFNGPKHPEGIAGMVRRGIHSTATEFRFYSSGGTPEAGIDLPAFVEPGSVSQGHCKCQWKASSSQTRTRVKNKKDKIRNKKERKEIANAGVESILVQDEDEREVLISDIRWEISDI